MTNPTSQSLNLLTTPLHSETDLGCMSIGYKVEVAIVLSKLVCLVVVEMAEKILDSLP